MVLLNRDRDVVNRTPTIAKIIDVKENKHEKHKGKSAINQGFNGRNKPLDL